MGTLLLAIILMIPITIVLAHSFIKMQRASNNNTIFTTTISYFIITVSFYIVLAIRVFNECYGKQEYTVVCLMIVGLIYGLHFMFLVLLLFSRLYYVFQTSVYKLSKSTVSIFISLCVIGLVDVMIFCYVMMTRKYFTVGVITLCVGGLLMATTTIGVTSLYIYKLFLVIRNNQKCTKSQDRDLLATISKYAVTTMFCVLSFLIFWGCAAVPLKYGFPKLFLYHFCLFVHVTVDNFCFILGYRYAEKYYTRFCGGINSLCMVCCGRLVMKSVLMMPSTPAWEDACSDSFPDMSKNSGFTPTTPDTNSPDFIENSV